jgi:hypothetical protein
MLASTMQFSRYGRYLARYIAYPPRRAVRRRDRSEGRSAEALDPSGPNNVPDGGCLGLWISIPVQGPVVLTRDRDSLYQIVDVPLNEQCCPETNARETAHGQVARRLPANCSLERR